MIGLIWAQAHDRVIGLDGVMPWHLSEDLAHFKEVTIGAPIIMGRKTWDSLPERFRPLPGRRNIVVTRDPSWSADGAESALELDEAIDRASEALDVGEFVWIIGGGQIFEQVLSRADRIELTEIDTAVEGDSFAPVLGTEWMRSQADPSTGWHTSQSGLEYRFVRLERAFKR